MISQRDDAHVAEGLALLTEQFRNKANIEAFLSSYLGRIQELEDELWIALWGWYLDNAEAGQLDDLGAIVGELREGRTDVEYEAAIRVRVRINRSKGRTIDVIDVADLLLASFLYTEFGFLEWQVDALNITTSEAIALVNALTKTKAASSYGVIVTSSWAAANVFRFDHEGDDVFLFGTSTGSTPDVKFPASLPTNPPYRRS